MILTCAWIGVGVVNSDLRSVFIKRSSKPKWAKLTIGRGIFTPRTYKKNIYISIKTKFKKEKNYLH
jgi:hypothetical protein